MIKVLPLFEKAKIFHEVIDAFKAMKKLTLSEAAWDLYRLKQLKLCWHEGLAAYRAHRQQRKEMVRDIEDLYLKKLMAKALLQFAEHRKKSQHAAMMADLSG